MEDCGFQFRIGSGRTNVGHGLVQPGLKVIDTIPGDLGNIHLAVIGNIHQIPHGTQQDILSGIDQGSAGLLVGMGGGRDIPKDLFTVVGPEINFTGRIVLAGNGGAIGDLAHLEAQLKIRGHGPDKLPLHPIPVNGTI